MSHVTLIDGAPGVGKTYTLREKLEDEANNGLGLDDFYWLNFSNAGRKDVQPEIADVYAGNASEARSDPEDRAKTFHGLALSLAIRRGMINGGSEDEQIIQQGQTLDGDYDPHADFARRHGMRYDPDSADPRKLLAGEGGNDLPANKLFAINDYLTQTCKPPEKWRDAGIQMRASGSQVEKLLDEWNEYKKSPPGLDRRLFEHGDYVHLAHDAHLVPDVDVLLIDEFQDLAGAEYRLYKLWRDHGVKTFYITGDPGQSLYSFRGGTPAFFEGTDVDNRIVLKKSYRCPENIARFAGSILSAHPSTDDRGFDGVSAGGRVSWYSIRNKRALRDALIESTDTHDGNPSALLLARTNYQLRDLTADLRSVGIPFDILGTAGSVWDDDMGDILAFLNNLVSGGDAFAMSHVRSTIDELPDPRERRRQMGRPFSGIITRDGIMPAISDFETIGDLIEKLQISKWKREIIHNAVEAPASVNTGEVSIGTIHTAKGLEAPAVYLFTESSESMVRRYRLNGDQAAEEHRTYYVGATRASENLHLVDSYFDGPMAPPIKKARSTTEAAR